MIYIKISDKLKKMYLEKILGKERAEGVFELFKKTKNTNKASGKFEKLMM